MVVCDGMRILAVEVVVARLDLVEDGLPEVREVGGLLLGPGVLGLEVRRDLGLALGPQPVVVVGPGPPVVRGGDGAPGCSRRGPDVST